jgi:putative serine protease PepD
MDPTGAGRLRGFRAPVADEVVGAPTGPADGPGTAGPADAVGPEGPDVVDTGPAASARTRRTGSWRWLVAAGAALVVAVAVIAALAFRLGSVTAASEASSPSPTPTPAPTATPLAVPDLYTRVVPSVVLITTSKGSLGSGTVVTDTGTILTAHHVVAGGGDLTVVFADGTKAPAKVASTDPAQDIATVVPQKLPEVVVPAALGGGVVVGADVVAMGNPLGLQASTTSGIVSGLGRTSRTDTGTVRGLIQFDAAVNPGSSGGPLLDAQGLVVGVVVSIADPGKDDAFAGIGFAVPIGAALGGGADGPGPGGGPQI